MSAYSWGWVLSGPGVPQIPVTVPSVATTDTGHRRRTQSRVVARQQDVGATGLQVKRDQAIGGVDTRLDRRGDESVRYICQHPHRIVDRETGAELGDRTQ